MGSDQPDDGVTGGAARPDFEIAIIGAGLGGLGMGIALRRAGITDFVILERADDIGGTWRDNTYPGIAVDIPAQAYQFSYALNPEWSRAFAEGAEVKAYIDTLTDRFELRPHLRFGAEVTERAWDDHHQLWRLRVGHGSLTARFVVSAIGAFVDPKPIDIPGVDSFSGQVMRSSRWDHDYDLSGKRVAVVGTGASAVQIIPEIAPIVAQLTVFQRTPIWVGPKRDPLVTERTKQLYRRRPSVQQRVRQATTRATELLLINLVLNHRRMPFIAHGLEYSSRNLWYRTQVKDPDVRRQLTPDYGFGCKRPGVSSTYLKTFNRPNVELVTTAIGTMTPSGIRTEGGVDRAFDAVIFATGFRMASDPENFRRTPVRGRDGFDLATFYTDQRLESYESVSVPKLPNHFMIFGPYGWTGGTWHQLVETASAHIVRIIQETGRRQATSVEVSQEATDRWTTNARQRLATSLFNTNNCGSAHSYYFDHHGDTPFLRPTSAAQAERASRTFPFDDYVFTYRATGPAPTATEAPKASVAL